VQLGGQLQAGAHQQGPHPLGPAALVAAEAEQVDAQLLHGQGQVAGGLGGVHVQQGALAVAEGRQRGQGLEHADLVVGGHHAHQQHVVAEGMLQRCGTEAAIAVHRQQGEGEAMAFEIVQGIQHRPVFAHQAHQPPAAAGSTQGRFGHALEGQVVGLGGAAGEHHPLGAGPQGGRHLGAGPLHCSRGFQPRPVAAAGRVGGVLAPPGRHRRHYSRVAGGAGLVVEVGEHGWSCLLPC
jgi:hypothetical protein